MHTVTLILLSLALTWHALGGAKHPEYCIVIDCGSTGTRLYVYAWTGGSNLTLPRVQDSGASSLRAQRGKAYSRKETQPGLDKFVGDSQGLRSVALEPLLAWAISQVPREARHSTPLFLFATAGLRRLPAGDSAWVLQETRGVLRGAPFLFRDEWARIISGVDEAVYGWIALNYASGHLRGGATRARERLRSAAAASASATEGSLDLGGSSLEVTFVPETEAAAAAVAAAVEASSLSTGAYASSGGSGPGPGRDEARVTIAASQYQLYAHSHEGYGMNDAFDRSVGALLQSVDFGELVASGALDPSIHGAGKAALIGKGARGDEDDDVAAEGEELPVVGHASAVGPGLLHVPALRHPCLHAGYNVTYELSRHSREVFRAKMAQQLTAGGASVQGKESGGSERPAIKRREGSSGVEEDFQKGLKLKVLVGADTQGGKQLHRGRLVLQQQQQQDEEERGAQKMSSARVDERKDLVELIGEPDWDRCQRLIAQVVRPPGADCGASAGASCALGAAQPALRGHFVGVAGFFVVYHFFGLAGSAPLAALLEAGRRFCGRPWGEVSATFGGEMGLDRYCFRAPYVVALLRDGLGLADRQVSVGEGSMGWTLGAALYEGGAVKALRHQKPNPMSLEHAGGHSLDAVMAGGKRPRGGGGAQNPDSDLSVDVEFSPALVLALVLLLVAMGTGLRWWRSRRAPRGGGSGSSGFLPITVAGGGGRISPRNGEQRPKYRFSPHPPPLDRSAMKRANQGGVKARSAEKGPPPEHERAVGLSLGAKHGASRRTLSQGDLIYDMRDSALKG
eukprot:jgi/Mesen1/8599/ME000005S08564